MSTVDQGFTIRISLTHVPSGKTVEYDEPYGWETYTRGEDWETDPVFCWEEGNFSCNCNRYLFFNRALDANWEEPESDEDRQCHTYDEYRVNWIRNNETGRVIYTEPANA